MSKKKKVEKTDIKFDKPVVWTPKMSVGEETIDRQHKMIFDTANSLLQPAKNGEELNLIRRTLHFLDDYINNHFVYEENYMKTIGYPKEKFSKHKLLHKSFIKSYFKLKDKLNQELGNKRPELIEERIILLLKECRQLVDNWLKNHIMMIDQDYHQFAKTHAKKAGIKNNIKIKLISKQRKNLEKIPELKAKEPSKEYIFTGIKGFDQLLEEGIPKGSSVIVAGGAGSGKTIFCLQTLYNNALKGKKGLYMTFEEGEDKLIQHMEDFGWNAQEMIKKGMIKIQRVNPFDITRNIDAILAKEKGELLIEIDPVILPKDFKPDFIVIDSLTAIASTFTSKEETYRIYIEQLFRFLEKSKATSFLVSETEQVPKIFSATGVEEFLADGVIVLYSIKHGNMRENAVELLKLRGASHKRNIVAMQITDDGIVIYPEQEIFSEF